jgi:hypothetical protein
MISHRIFVRRRQLGLRCSNMRRSQVFVSFSDQKRSIGLGCTGAPGGTVWWRADRILLRRAPPITPNRSRPESPESPRALSARGRSPTACLGVGHTSHKPCVARMATVIARVRGLASGMRRLSCPNWTSCRTRIASACACTARPTSSCACARSSLVLCRTFAVLGIIARLLRLSVNDQ